MIIFRNYRPPHGFTDDFQKVKSFLHSLDENHSNGFCTMNAVRWEWSFSLPYFNKQYINKIGLWEDCGKLVALATYETELKDIFIVIDEDYSYLKKDVLRYAREGFAPDKKVFINIPDHDRQLQTIAREMGLTPTQKREDLAVFETRQKPDYTLEDGFSIVSLKDNCDVKQYGAVLYRGFDHGDFPPDTIQEYNERAFSLSGPGNDLSLKIAVVSPENQFVSFCGMWYSPGDENAYVEPVATDPKYRNRGFGRAAVLEGIRRCMAHGAKRAYVGSPQQFYYNIGFDPVATFTFWQ